MDPELAREVEELRQRDQTTGLLNRPTFLRILEDAVGDAGQHRAQYGLLLLEPDNYQRILQEIGLDCADDLLAAMSGCLQEALGERLAETDLYDLQEDYVQVFDRTRTLSLNLYEHVHGESRDRVDPGAPLQHRTVVRPPAAVLVHVVALPARPRHAQP